MHDLIVDKESLQALFEKVDQMERATEEAQIAAFVAEIVAHPLYLKFRDNLARLMIEQIGCEENFVGSYASGAAIAFITKFYTEKRDLLELVNRIVLAANDASIVEQSCAKLLPRVRKSYQRSLKAQNDFLIIFGELFKKVTRYDDFINQKESE